MSPPKKFQQFEHWCAASHKEGLCFPLARWFLWVPECKNRARTYNDLCFFGDDPRKKFATSWIVDARLFANGACARACFSLSRRFLWAASWKSSWCWSHDRRYGRSRERRQRHRCKCKFYRGVPANLRQSHSGGELWELENDSDDGPQKVQATQGEEM